MKKADCVRHAVGVQSSRAIHYACSPSFLFAAGRISCLSPPATRRPPAVGLSFRCQGALRAGGRRLRPGVARRVAVRQFVKSSRPANPAHFIIASRCSLVAFFPRDEMLVPIIFIIFVVCLLGARRCLQ